MAGRYGKLIPCGLPQKKSAYQMGDEVIGSRVENRRSDCSLPVVI